MPSQKHVFVRVRVIHDGDTRLNHRIILLLILLHVGLRVFFPNVAHGARTELSCAQIGAAVRAIIYTAISCLIWIILVKPGRWLVTSTPVDRILVCRVVQGILVELTTWAVYKLWRTLRCHSLRAAVVQLC